jgi:hypothetical protein
MSGGPSSPHSFGGARGSTSAAGRGAWGRTSTAHAAIADGHWHSFGNAHFVGGHPVFVHPGFGCCFFGFGVGFGFGFGFGWPGWGPFWGGPYPYYPYYPYWPTGYYAPPPPNSPPPDSTTPSSPPPDLVPPQDNARSNTATSDQQLLQRI